MAAVVTLRMLKAAAGGDYVWPSRGHIPKADDTSIE